MATIAEALRGKLLEEYRLPEREEREPLRRLIVAGCLFDEVDGDERYMDGSVSSGGRTPLDHLETLFSDLRCAKRPPVGDLRRMRPNHQGVWKCHAPTLRVFGWCSGINCFVPVTVALEKDLKATRTLYGDKQRFVVDFIRQHDLTQTVMKGEILEIFPAKG